MAIGMKPWLLSSIWPIAVSPDVMDLPMKWLYCRGFNTLAVQLHSANDKWTSRVRRDGGGTSAGSCQDRQDVHSRSILAKHFRQCAEWRRRFKSSKDPAPLLSHCISATRVGVTVRLLVGLTLLLVTVSETII
eukprot:scaffold50766_cov47-Cyclotella_meneghiniana.AAC.3